MSEEKDTATMDKIVSLCKRRGFIFQSSEIYGGFNGFWDYGPYGVTMRRAIEKLWWKFMVEDRNNVVGLDSSIICHPRVWEASGHLSQFSDLMTDCTECKKRYRVDQMEDPTTCPNCNSKKLTEPREFNLMMKTFVGPVFSEENVAWLRAETCQPIFVDYDTIRVTGRQKLPFGIAQTGKAFRNEINPRNFTFRSREFTQMEMEFFCNDEQSMDWYNTWRDERRKFYTTYLQFDDTKLQFKDHDKLAHYAKAAVDIEFKFPFGWGEIEGIHHRGTWDLSRHEEFSGESLKYFDQETRERFWPTVVETSCGLDRIFLAIMCNAYQEDMADTAKEGKDEEIRISLKIPAAVAPVQVAILPLVKKLDEPAQKIFKALKKHFRCEYDLTGSIGKRYRRQDEIGTPYCVTIDFDTIEQGTGVTLRDRDTMTQERIPLNDLIPLLKKKIFPWEDANDDINL